MRVRGLLAGRSAGQGLWRRGVGARAGRGRRRLTGRGATRGATARPGHSARHDTATGLRHSTRPDTTSRLDTTARPRRGGRPGHGATRAHPTAQSGRATRLAGRGGRVGPDLGCRRVTSRPFRRGLLGARPRHGSLGTTLTAPTALTALTGLTRRAATGLRARAPPRPGPRNPVSRLHAERGAALGGQPGLRPGRGGQQLVVFARVKLERLGEQPHRGQSGGAALAGLEPPDAADPHTGALGELLLRQALPAPPRPQQRPELAGQVGLSVG